MGKDVANITFQMGRLHIAPPNQFGEGPVHQYFVQGYNVQDYQQQPPSANEGGDEEEDEE